MFDKLRDSKYQFFWILFHLALGFVSVYTPVMMILWFWLLAADLLIKLFTRQNRDNIILFFIVYSLGYETLNRSAWGAPFIPYELGKYVAPLGFMLGILFGGTVKKPNLVGWIVLFLSIPGLFTNPDMTFKDITFNYFGLLGICLGIIYCCMQKVTFDELKQLLRIAVYSILSVGAFSMFKQATYEKVVYGLAANFETAGGTATNQVATIFGAAVAIIGLMYIAGQKLFDVKRFKYMDLAIMAFLAIRGLLTFSRGGMISGVLALIIVVLIPKSGVITPLSREVKFRKIHFATVFSTSIFMVGFFVLVNSITGNFLLLRYQGVSQHEFETGWEKKGGKLNNLTSGREEISATDIAMFLDHPALGVGVGKSRFERANYGDFGSQHLPHVEVTRMLAEHGAPGLVIALFFLFYPVSVLFNEKDNFKKCFSAVCFIIAISSTFHNAMRTMTAPVLYSLGFLNIVPTTYDWRQRFRTKAKTRIAPQPGNPVPEPLPGAIIQPAFSSN